ncbi:hypothetical protein [Halopseudomonas bauzanensis]|uniref:Uncharacterized protein n=1 Tax=Halopseudomonas bauzanensis TaxID=653930 RepID=A0A1I4K053_9GAMM|nr:hypothetical protein [Halopseudomonas bauzanensis]SER49590.1 hypothetical protein SAMN05216589_0728 [Halopseudomonas bauzanensis]SFL72165.1 hypothetical protein SAMN04487855_0897 [Halopseudomonas bauzanensis]
MAVFEVVFHGQVRADVAPEQARARIGQLFQVGDRQLEMLFSGRRIVIKQGLDQAAAEKYRQAIERAGALCDICPMADSPAEPSPAATPPPVASPQRQQRAAVQPRDEYMAAFKDVDAPDLPIAPLGADMQDSYADPVPPDLDLSALSLAPPGSDLEQVRAPPPPAAPDTGHLRLADEG